MDWDSWLTKNNRDFGLEEGKGLERERERGWKMEITVKHIEETNPSNFSFSPSLIHESR
ncbi:hypothetical protein FH972_013446 [Carpinus fangiana]|uniref:Uncharacterized protein n=1 Tax=Carpinus fangiana TaxID=176857 RepID=A0A5N6R6T0_9ROSI|nr:hypothetical protein FH972_013446 [Carpinus fangiana]